MRAADTNVLVRVITGDDERQLPIAEAFIAEGAWVSHVVLAETIWVLGDSYDLDRAELAAAVAMLLSNPNLAMEDREVVTAALEQFRRNPRLGFSDCLILEIARKAGHVPLGTFDRHLARLPQTQRL